MTQRSDGPSAAVRLRALKRDRFTCSYCGVSGTDAELEIDHIVPVSGGGSHHISNLTTACRSCNQQKGSKEASVFTPWIHTHKDDGAIQYQGQIIDVDGDIVLVQLYEWFMGFEGSIEAIPKSTIYSVKHCTIYPTNEHMNEAYRIYSRRRERQEFTA